MADPLGLVYSGRDDTGAASVLKGRVSLGPLLESEKAKNKKATQDMGKKLAKVDNKMGIGWDHDFDYLQKQYSEIEDMVWAYEKADREQKPKMKKGINAAINKLRFNLHKSSMNEKEFLQNSGDLDKDKGGYYSKDSRKKLEDWKNTPLNERSDTPALDRASLQGYMADVVKSVGYELDTETIGVRTKTSDGYVKSDLKTTRILDEKKLRESIEASLDAGSIPENKANMLQEQAVYIAGRNNPGLILKSDQEIKDIVRQTKVDMIYDNMKNSYRQLEKNLYVREMPRPVDEDDWVYSGVQFTSSKGNTRTEYFGPTEEYPNGGFKLTVRARKNTSVIPIPTLNWNIKGSDLAKIAKSGTVDGVKLADNPEESFFIDGKLDAIEYGENGEQPMLLITPINIVQKKLGRSGIIKIPLNVTNQVVLDGYDLPLEDILENTKEAAMETYKGKAAPPRKTVPAPSDERPSATSRQDPTDPLEAGPTKENTKEDNPYQEGTPEYKKWHMDWLKVKFKVN